MKYGRWILLVTLCFALALVGCSKKQEEAAKLEQELEGQSAEQRELDSVAAAVDSVLAELDDGTTPTTTPDEAVKIVTAQEEEPAPEMPSRPDGDGYAVQIASCEDSDYARTLVDKYSKRGYEPWVVSFVHNEQTFYRVRLGPFSTESEANQVKLELIDKYSVPAWVDPVSQ
jgi:cell division septation protein DedD